MKDYKKLNLALLTKQDEEYHILEEISEEYTRQHAQKTTEKKSGDATEIVIRNHLHNHGFNVSPNCVFINGCNKEIDLLILKGEVPSNQKYYSPKQVRTVLEIKNNAVGGQKRNGVVITPSMNIRLRFDDIENTTKLKRFGVVVVSERLLSPKPYKYAIDEDEIGKSNCRVFTCVLRRKWARLRDKDVVVEMQESGQLWQSNEWQDLINYLRGN
jgi:hypothetical protein